MELPLCYIELVDSEGSEARETSPLSSSILTVKPFGEYRCECVKVHRPTPTELHAHHVWPKGEGGPDVRANLVYICPTTHSSIHKLWRLMDHYHGDVPPGERRPFARYVRDLVQRGWDEKMAAQKETPGVPSEA